MSPPPLVHTSFKRPGEARRFRDPMPIIGRWWKSADPVRRHSDPGDAQGRGPRRAVTAVRAAGLREGGEDLRRRGAGREDLLSLRRPGQDRQVHSRPGPDPGDPRARRAGGDRGRLREASLPGDSVAIEPCGVVSIPEHEFFALIERRPEITRAASRGTDAAPHDPEQEARGHDGLGRIQDGPPLRDARGADRAGNRAKTSSSRSSSPARRSPTWPGPPSRRPFAS